MTLEFGKSSTQIEHLNEFDVRSEQGSKITCFENAIPQRFSRESVELHVNRWEFVGSASWTHCKPSSLVNVVECKIGSEIV